MKRSIDYLETRADIDHGKLAYLGFSWGARIGTVALALEDRLKVGVLLAGGFNPVSPRPEVSETNFHPAVRKMRFLRPQRTQR